MRSEAEITEAQALLESVGVGKREARLAVRVVEAEAEVVRLRGVIDGIRSDAECHAHQYPEDQRFRDGLMHCWSKLALSPTALPVQTDDEAMRRWAEASKVTTPNPFSPPVAVDHPPEAVPVVPDYTDDGDSKSDAAQLEVTVDAPNPVAALPDVTDDETDDLQRLIEKAEAERPGVREAREDIKHLHAVLDDLIELRKSSGITQGVVAERMGVTQPTVSQFESESGDPHVSTLQRYARALGLRIIITAQSAHGLPDVQPQPDTCPHGFTSEHVIRRDYFDDGDGFTPISCPGPSAVPGDNK